jgi:protein-S-isoprenylcysteine O-methyltransferase Ste14
MKDLIPRIVTGIIGLSLFAGVWFAIAGRVTWWQGWISLLAFILFVGILSLRLAKVNPGLMQERNRPAGQAEAWDRVVMSIYTVLLIVQMVIAALDGGRYAWSSVSPGIQVLGWLLLIFAGIVVWHVMMINAYLSSWSRLQEDRGQVVVTEGLYRYVRHPMYLGVMVAFVGLPLVLGSWWALVPSLPNIGLFAYRTYREDNMLKDGLPGYSEYAREVRYRLLPGIW